MTADVAFLRTLYRNRFHISCSPRRNQMWHVLYKHWFMCFIPEDSVYLELGAGRCELVNQLKAKEKTVIDANPDIRLCARPETNCIVDDLLSGLLKVPSRSQTHIVASNVFEHLPNRDYYFRVLREIFRVLGSNGSLIVMGPNITYVRERYWDFADHVLPFNDKGMVESLQAARFEIVYLKKEFLPYCTKCSLPQWCWLVRLYLVVPIFHWMFGEQFFIVARKP
jgi:hypothetical protein